MDSKIYMLPGGVTAVVPQSIKAKLVELGVTQQEIAQDLGVTRQAVCRTISGSCVSRPIQRKVARIIGRPVSQVFTPKKHQPTPQRRAA